MGFIILVSILRRWHLLLFKWMHQKNSPAGGAQKTKLLIIIIITIKYVEGWPII